MAFYYSRRKLRPHEEGHAGELNIVPYLDILMNLIIFMLLSMTGLAAFGILNVSAPNYGNAAAGPGQEPDQPKLLLTVNIAHKGFFIAGAGAVLGASDQANGAGAPTVVKKADGTYDYAALTGWMVRIKKDFPAETKVIIAGEADTPYEALIGTMDAIRETPADHKLLFPDVTLGVFSQ
jgi:biopolymer transport protein TolR